MGMKYKEVGGGPATGLADDFVKFLQGGLKTGSFGAGSSMGQAGAADPGGSTMGIAGILNDLLAGGAGKIGGGMADMISKQGDRDAASLRARYGANGGTAFGTGAQYAEAMLRSDTAPKMTQAVGGLQMQALSQILPLIMGLSQKGITQREGMMEENPWMTAAKIGMQGAGAVAGFMAGGPMGAAAGAQMGGMALPKPNMTFSGSPMDAYPQQPAFNPASFNPSMFGYTPTMGYA